MGKLKPPPVLPDYDKVHVGRRFEALRAARGMTPTEWALAIGDKCSPQKIWNYERGHDQVPLQYAARACILTGASFDYIYRGSLAGLSNKLVAQLTHARVLQSGKRRS